MTDERAATERRTEAGGAGGLQLYGVIRARSWRGSPEPDDARVARIRFRDLEALVRPAPFDVAVVDDAKVLRHQRLIERVMRRGTILPAPYGVIFRDRDAVLRFLEDQYLTLDEGLAFVHGHWELRLHVRSTARVAEPDDDRSDRALLIYTELRRSARAAIPFPREEGRLLGAAFLVDRSQWVEFIERAETLGGAQPELTVDVTGPWPPYDFVKIVV